MNARPPGQSAAPAAYQSAVADPLRPADEVAREALALHGGDLRLVEAAEGGAAFELRLPA